MTTLQECLAANLNSVRQDIDLACRKVGRDRADVTLVAVTKYAAWQAVQELAELHSVFGESRPQQLAERAPRLPHIKWHLIGQLQRNKVHLAIQHACLIHSVDSLRLLERMQTVAAEHQIRPRVLLQVNLSREASKSGFAADQIQHSWPQIMSCTSTIQIDGLMTMAAESDDPDDARPVFRQLRQLRDELVSLPLSAEHQLLLPQLSMGMSGDFVPAIEEGATLIRVGSRLFEGVDDAGNVSRG